MTTIILVAVGVLLAVAAALMVVFYGGAAFNGGDAKARAATLLNAGGNVVASYDLYRSQEGADASGIAGLIASGTLAQRPELRGVGTPSDAWRVDPSNSGGSPLVSYVVTDVPVDVCAHVNTSVGIVDIPLRQRGRMGCFRPSGVVQPIFYAVLSGAAAGFNEWRDAAGNPIGIVAPRSMAFYDSVTSRDGRTSFTLQGDGHLCLYTQPGMAYGSWCNGVHDYGSTATATFVDGLLTVRRPSGEVLWSAGEAGHPGAALVVLDEGRVQIRTPDQKVLWSDA